MKTMRPRELAGAIRRASAIYVFVDYAPHPEGALYLRISRSDAHVFVEEAKLRGITEIAAEEHVVKGKNELKIGPPDEEEEEEEPAMGEEEE